MVPGGLWWSNVLNSAVPPQRLRPDIRLECQDPLSHMAQKKREKKRKKKNIKIKKIKNFKIIIKKREQPNQ